MVKRCAHGLCSSDSRKLESGVYFIPFVKPSKNREKCLRWITACNRSGFSVDKITKDTYICSKHFVGNQGPTEENPDPCFATADGYEQNNRVQKKLATDSVANKTATLNGTQFTIIIEVEASDTKEIFLKVKPPENWTSILLKKNLLYSMYLVDKNVLTLKINEFLCPSLIVLGKELSSTHPIREHIPDKIIYINQVTKLFRSLDHYDICTGNSEQKFVSLVTSKNVKDSQIVWLTNSVHHTDCLLLTDSGGNLCRLCSKLRTKLRYHVFYESKREPPSIVPKRACNVRYMTNEQIRKQLKIKCRQLLLAERKFKRLRRKVLNEPDSDNEGKPAKKRKKTATESPESSHNEEDEEEPVLE